MTAPARERRRRRTARSSVVLVAVIAVVSCGGGGGDDDGPRGGESEPATGWVGDLRAAVDAVETELGTGQRYFEVTATPQLTNVFVAVDEATAVSPYVYVDGALLDPARPLSDASGHTFDAEQIDFDEDTVLAGVDGELPETTIDALSVEGGPNGSVRYVVSARSARGGVLDIEVRGDGAIVAVDPL